MQAASESLKPAVSIIFIEKRRSYPPSLRRRQAKVSDSCSHERKALWRPPDIERETRDEGGLPTTWYLSRTCNAFLTKMDASLPATNCECSPSKLLPMNPALRH